MTATAILDVERTGFSREQVEALAPWHEAGLDLSHLATKADLADVRTELRGDLRGEIAAAKFDTIRWLIGVGIVQIRSLLGVAYAIPRLFPGGRP
jgi:hypothetical protein